MWKKDEFPGLASDTPAPEEKAPRAEAPRMATKPGERATIGPSITIKGEVSGDEDLLIQGRVDGSVDLKSKSVTVGREGRVKANITGRVVIVEGEVEGDLKAEEQIVLRSSAKVHGDITAARVVLEDGARFRGGVDMGDPDAQGKGIGASSLARSKDVPEPPTVGSKAEKTEPEGQKAESGTAKVGSASADKANK